VPPSALPPKKRTPIDLPVTALSPYVGVYELATGLTLDITMRDAALFAKSSNGGDAVRLWPESKTDFFIKEADAQVSFARDATGTVTGLVLHQFGRDRPAKKTR
jgi:hypothetical protein